MRDKQGNLLASANEQEKRWTEHFEDVLNRDAPTKPPDLVEAPEDLEVNLEAPTVQEIHAAIQDLKNGKAPGCDNLNAELFKADPMLAARQILPLFTATWTEKRIPEGWRKGTIIKIPKETSVIAVTGVE